MSPQAASRSSRAGLPGAGPGAARIRSLACPVCPYWVTGRCEGLDAAGSSLRLPGAIGCREPARQARYYANLHDGELEPASASGLPIPPLPAFIPVLVRVLPSAVRLDPSRLYGVALTTVLRRTGDVRYATPSQMRRQLGLGEGGRLCLIGTAKDARLENAWAGSERNDLWRRLAGLSFEFTTTTTFSVWDRQARFDQIYNQERNLRSYDRFAGYGLPVAPFLFFPARTDLEATLAWLEAHPVVDLIGILAQFYRSSEAFGRLLGGMKVLRDAVPRPLRFLVTGCATAGKLERLFAEFPSATVASTQPVMKALRGHATRTGLRHSAAWSTKREHLVAGNVARHLEFCEALRPSAPPPAARRWPTKPVLVHRGLQQVEDSTPRTGSR
jgi:hypothetical protein